MASDIPPFDRTASSSSRRTLRTTAQDSSHRTVISPLEGQGESAGPYDMPQATTQNPASEHGGQSGGDVHRRSSRKTTALPDPPPPMPIDLQPSDTSELQRGQVQTQVDGHLLGGAGQSQSNPRGTPGGRSASRKGVRSGKGSRGPPVRDNNKGRPRPGVRPNDPKPSRMLLVLTLPYPYLTHLAARFSM